MGAAPFEQDDIVPDTVQMAVTFAVTHLAKSARQMQRRTRGIRCHHLCLQRPIAFAFGRGNQSGEQCAPHAVPLCARRNVDADLSDAGGTSCIGNWRECRPSGHAPFAIARDETSYLQVGAVPVVPLRRTGCEGCNAGTQSFGVNALNFRPVASLHRLDREFQGGAL